jgi:hypothetical protein
MLNVITGVPQPSNATGSFQLTMAKQSSSELTVIFDGQSAMTGGTSSFNIIF